MTALERTIMAKNRNKFKWIPKPHVMQKTLMNKKRKYPLTLPCNWNNRRAHPEPGGPVGLRVWGSSLAGGAHALECRRASPLKCPPNRKKEEQGISSLIGNYLSLIIITLHPPAVEINTSTVLQWSLPYPSDSLIRIQSWSALSHKQKDEVRSHPRSEI